MISHCTLNPIKKNHALCKSTISNHHVKLRWLLINLNDHRLDWVGIDQNTISSMCVEGTIGECGIFIIIIDIGTNLGDELQGLVNIDSIPLIDSTTLPIPI